ncbi:MAG: tRNA1(Val) (adenine(37)-N6)-methyltransferase [Verrucomicrobiales bacterium]
MDRTQPPDRISNPRAVVWQAERESLQAELGESITLDALTGPRSRGLENELPLIDDAGAPAGWLIAQRSSGHRHSIDDVLTAWFALRVAPDVRLHLDLGTGIGTVGLLVLSALAPEARLTGIEAQETSYRLWQSNLAANGIANRVSCHHGDLRDLHLEEKFPLVTGSPPYFPIGTGVLPQDSQKAHARFELRGDVADYAEAARRHLAPDGWFVFCFPTPQKPRALNASAQAGLTVVEIIDVIPRAGLQPLFSLYACRQQLEGEPVAPPPSASDFTVREESGRLSAEMAAVRRGFGFLDSEAHGGHG